MQSTIDLCSIIPTLPSSSTMHFLSCISVHAPGLLTHTTQPVIWMDVDEEGAANEWGHDVEMAEAEEEMEVDNADSEVEDGMEVDGDDMEVD